MIHFRWVLVARVNGPSRRKAISVSSLETRAVCMQGAPDWAPPAILFWFCYNPDHSLIGLCAPAGATAVVITEP
jgi:hypothetical protein